jgi:hypothetical protein
MWLRRFLFLTGIFTLIHGILTVTSVVIAVSRGFDIDHPVEPTYLERASGTIAGILMQPIAAVTDFLSIPLRSSLVEWTAILLNSLTWGATLALIVCLFARHRAESARNLL